MATKSSMKTEASDAGKLHKNRAFSYALVDKFSQPFIDPKTGKFYPRHVRMRNCPVCGGKKHKEIFFKGGGTYVKCENCTMVFPNPVFKDSSLTEYYISLDSGQAQITANEAPFYREIYSKGLSAITRFVKRGNILDIGCGSGFFLDIAREKKWETTGIELGIAEATIAKSRGHRIFTDGIEKMEAKEKFSVITLWDVFEHIVEGAPYLKALKKRLSKGGIVYMQIPNSGSLAARVLQEKCRMFDGLEHVSLYNPHTIELMAKKAGFKIIHMETVISEMAVLKNYLDYEHPYFGSSKNKGDLLDFINPEDIHKHKLGYKMQIVMKPV
jgi:2-polyprenyl-3-methyl-5-hydroxy-6-metoxy-1,4-benzoquinol methylase